MNEQQQQMLEDRISDALLAPLTDAQLMQLDKLMENPATTEDQVEHFIRSAGVDFDGITKQVTEAFLKEQNITPAQLANMMGVQPAQAQAQPQAQPAVQPQVQTPQPNVQFNNAQGAQA
ncbi:MAG: hypothetical protein HUJ63_01480 [Enterococcus sp.]|nr:hypothetical protein [Enterococcus sp.]